MAETTFSKAGADVSEEIVFENPAHGFPQRVSYWLVPGGRLLARIEGTHDGVTRHRNT